MNILADESVDRHIVENLRQQGHKVEYIAEIEPSISDEEVFDRADKSSALLLTADKDFGEIVFRQNRLSSGGVVLLRLAGLPSEKKAKIVSNAFQQHGSDFIDHFSVVSAGPVRIHAQK